MVQVGSMPQVLSVCQDQPGSHLLCLPGSRARRTTVDKVDIALDDKDDEQPPLEGEDLAGVSDCASTVMRERVENLKEPGNIWELGRSG